MSIINDTTRWTAVPNDDEAVFVIDIFVAAPSGGHVAGVIGFHDYGKPCAATYAHANLIANAPLLLSLLRQASAALPDAWAAVRCGVPCELIEAIDAGIKAATAPSLPPTPPVAS